MLVGFRAKGVTGAYLVLFGFEGFGLVLFQIPEIEAVSYPQARHSPKTILKYGLWAEKPEEMGP